MSKGRIKRIAALMIISLMVLSSSVCYSSTESSSVVNVIRAGGANRYETSLVSAEIIREEIGRETFDSVIIASGSSFPDALSGSYLSCRLTAPIVLVSDGNTAGLDYVKSILPETGGTVFILGGTGAVSESIENDLIRSSGCRVVRLGGSDRYETNLKILDSIDMTGKDLLVCTGKNYADSLSASATGLPILLVKDGLSDRQESFITAHPGLKVTILGGNGAVEQSVEERLTEMGAECVRLSGQNREETSYLAASTFFPHAKNAAIAFSQNYPDGLCGGLLAHAIGAPVLLVKEDRYSFARQFVSDKGVINGRVIGGKGAVSDLTASRVFGCAEADIKAWAGRERYSIDYVLNGGVNSPDNPASFLTGDVIGLRPAEREGYSFQGWYLDKALSKKIEYITGALQNDIILYAKWYLASINVNETGSEDMIWSWWYYPQAVSDDSDGLKLFWGFTTSQGFSGVAEYDDRTAEVTKTFLKRTEKVDDHNGAAVEIMDDGRIMCAYSAGHDLEKEVHIRISDQPLDITGFGTEIVLESAGKTSYSQIIRSNGRYYVFYRVNSKLWAYRDSEDGLNWNDEVLLIRADEQYYCRFIETEGSDLIRILMYSNPAGTANDIRMGFFDPSNGKVLNSDAETVLGSSNVRYDSFGILLSPEEGKVQRLFDAAVTSPDHVRFLLAGFTAKKNVNDSVYYLYEDGRTIEICKGGKALWDPKYQLGASFLSPDAIAVMRNENDEDILELYEYSDRDIHLEKQIYRETTGAEWNRNARPIADRNGRAILWHRGYYDPSVYTHFNTSACIYFTREGLKRLDGSFHGITEELRRREYSEVDQAALTLAREYIDRIYSENNRADYTLGGFTWYHNDKIVSWMYTTGFMFQGFLECDSLKYNEMIREYYRQHITQDGRITNYIYGELDSLLPAVGMIDLIRGGYVGEDEKILYEKALSFAYRELEKQTVYPTAGMMYQHSERNGVPTSAWSKWNFCLDGIYMSQLFLIRMAEAIDEGSITVIDGSGKTVTTDEIWDDIYSRFSFVMENMVCEESGLPDHGYCVPEEKTNGVSWSRGVGWFAMALMEAAEKYPSEERRLVLNAYFKELMDSVMRWQDSDSFLWYNVTDHREEVTDNIPESSASGMFAYCLLKGSSIGLLDGRNYREAGMRAFNALVRDRLGEDGLRDIMSSSGVTSDINRYAVNHYVVNEAKGIAALALCIKYVEE